MSFGTSNLIWGISQKKNGQMHPGKSSNRRLSFLNQKKFFKKFGISPDDVVSADLVHGGRVKAVNRRQAGKIIAKTDALITDEQRLFLSITIADCLPVYFHDPAKGVIGLAHAGWRGVLENIAAKTVRAMTKNYAANPTDVRVFMGPHIRKCHFEVRADVADKFKAYEKFVIRRINKSYIDLAGIVKAQLTASGVKLNNLGINRDCTFCSSRKYFSYRRDGQLMTMVAYIGLKRK